MTRTLFGIGEAGCFPEPDADLHDLAAEARARAGAGDALARLALGRRVDAAARRLHPAVHVVAARVRAVRRARRHLGDRVLPLVPRRPGHSPVGQRSGAGAAAAGARDGAGARPDAVAAAGLEASVWLLCVQYACLAYGWWFYVTWLPTYLRNVARHQRQDGRAPCRAAVADRRRRLPDLGWR